MNAVSPSAVATTRRLLSELPFGLGDALDAEGAAIDASSTGQLTNHLDAGAGIDVTEVFATVGRFATESLTVGITAVCAVAITLAVAIVATVAVGITAWDITAPTVIGLRDDEVCTAAVAHPDHAITRQPKRTVLNALRLREFTDQLDLVGLDLWSAYILAAIS